MKKRSTPHIITVVVAICAALSLIHFLAHLDLHPGYEYAALIFSGLALSSIVLASARMDNRRIGIEELVLGAMAKTHRVVKLIGIQRVDPSSPFLKDPNVRLERFINNQAGQLSRYVTVTTQEPPDSPGGYEERYTLLVVERKAPDAPLWIPD